MRFRLTRFRNRPVLPAVFSVLAGLILLTAGRPDPERGKQIFDTVCAGCHSLTPPPDLAPPMIMVVGHYVQESESEDAARAAMQAWIPAPDSARSLLPSHAIERFGLMDPLPLPEEDLKAVVEYVFLEWEKAERPEPHGPQCDGEACGEGMQHRHGEQGDEAPQDGQGMQHRHGMQNGQGCAGGMCKKMQQDGEQNGQGCAGGMCRHGQQGGDAPQNGQGMQHRHGMQMMQNQGGPSDMPTGHVCPRMPKTGQDQ